MKLRPMICENCGTVNEIQEMLNTANCIREDCNGFMQYIDEDTYVEIEIQQENDIK